ncbi:autotransporter domain-containing protein [Erythrobacter sp. SCSIO 43205]|uniref:autotransporter domain-containing protein n=1 Tax=Erythrobacter sp. SCSIO 43205 TaxID=2779361 RepID=UPI001CA87662|nr:autotransporter domain-containing protein [Erythrobacter sp. SCSIO 43205]UAB79034.1 autotransporter domain-containing protein [Erythrobacter sp. SCSIO 43205]
MKNRILMSGVGSIALAGALAASPAYANDGVDADLVGPVAEDTETADGYDARAAVAPLNTFSGLDTGALSVTMTDVHDFRVSRTSDDYIGSINGPDQQLIVRDDVGVDFGDPDDTAPYAVHIFIQDNISGGVFFNCSGSVINPRTVLFAAHCVNQSSGGLATFSSEEYGLPESGASTTMLVSTGQDSFPRLINTIQTGAGYADGGAALSTDVIIHPTGNLDNTGLGFPWADVAMIALDAPITDVPSLPILLTPLTELTHVLQVGYGTNGTGLTGGTNAGDRFLRRVGENMLGMVGSLGDYIDPIFPDFAPSTVSLGFESQAYYWTDFDDPNRTPEASAGCVFPGDTISCESLEAVYAIDYFDGDALAGEAGTAPGDSGSPLVADQLADFPLAIGVLSGGFDFFGLGSAYSDVSFYNPLYPFFEFITENTPYKYVSAKKGNGNWSDPTHWTQDLDPGFFIQDETGAIVNGIPTGNEPGIFESGPKLGTVLGVDISGNDGTITPGFEGIDTTLPESSALLGPGSTGFVPQNTDGTPGVAFANPAQYFEVHLNNKGRTTVDMDVEIDKLVVNSSRAKLHVDSPYSFTTIQDIEQFGGLVVNDGVINTPFYYLVGGELAGDGGTINTNALLNIEGVLSAGGIGHIGSMTINGDYLQTSGGALWSDYARGSRRSVVSDTYDITGTAFLDGTLVVAADGRRPRFGTEYTVLTAGAIDGAFDDTVFIGRSAILTAESRVEGNEVVVKFVARSLRGILGFGHRLEELGTVLDVLRQSRFAEFAGLFDYIDAASIDTLGATLSSITPVNAFNQTFAANAMSQRFTGQIAQRNLTLRDGSRASGAFSAAGNASFAIAGGAPAEIGKIGVFGTASGIYRNGGQIQQGVTGNGFGGFGAFGVNGVSTGTIGANAFEQAALTQAGEITVGADMRLSEGFSFGVAVSNIRNSQDVLTGGQTQGDLAQSVAIYASYNDGGLFADGYAGSADLRLGANREAQGEFALAYDNAIGQSDSSQVFGGVRMGYAFDLADGIEMGPVASVDYLNNRIGGYDETGAGAFGLSIDDRTFTSVGAKLGAMASFDIKTSEKSALRAFGSVAYARELGDTEDVVSAHFFGAADTPFSISNSLDPEWVSVNAGAEMLLGNNFSASLSVTSDMGRGVLSNDQAQASLSWRF